MKRTVHGERKRAPLYTYRLYTIYYTYMQQHTAANSTGKSELFPSQTSCVNSLYILCVEKYNAVNVTY